MGFDRQQRQAVAEGVLAWDLFKRDADRHGETGNSRCADYSLLVAIIACYSKNACFRVESHSGREGFGFLAARDININSFRNRCYINGKARREGIGHLRQQCHLSLVLLSLRNLGEGHSQIQSIPIRHDERL